jgi:hypothetical protein
MRTEAGHEMHGTWTMGCRQCRSDRNAGLHRVLAGRHLNTPWELNMKDTCRGPLRNFIRHMRVRSGERERLRCGEWRRFFLHKDLILRPLPGYCAKAAGGVRLRSAVVVPSTRAGRGTRLRADVKRQRPASMQIEQHPFNPGLSRRDGDRHRR